MELRVYEIGVVRCCGQGWRGLWTWRSADLVPIVVDGEVGVVRRCWAWLLLLLANLLCFGWIGDVAAEAGFEAVPTPVCEEGLHASGTETGGWRAVEVVPAVVVHGVAVDALPLRFPPAYTPCAVLG